MKFFLLTFLFLFFLFTSPSIFAAPGDLDPTFTAGGFLNFSTDANAASDMVVQPDGKAIAAGTTGSYGAFNFFLARFNSSGIGNAVKRDSSASLSARATGTSVAADYDGDGRADVAVYRNGTRYLNRSTAGFIGVAFGADADRPTSNAFVF